MRWMRRYQMVNAYDRQRPSARALLSLVKQGHYHAYTTGGDNDWMLWQH